MFLPTLSHARRWIAVLPILLVALVVATLTAALALGGPTPPPTMRSISDPFKVLSLEGMPPLSRFMARDGSELAYRRYAPADGQPTRGSVMLVHGSSANSQSVHPLAQSLAQAGYAVYAFDIRGHGASGQRGRIDYIGQLDDDLEDFMRAVRPVRPATLAGFSSGGGFALRVAGDARQGLFDNYLFMSPYVHFRAATARSRDAGGWVSIGTPRLVALSLLNRVGVTHWNQLPVVDFAVADSPQADLTNSYSYALAANFQPHEDYHAGIRAIGRPAE
ncbi:MAG TPA: alpha/beta fold hydrolase, partial [Variovorax sp.]